ncbi:MAG: PIN domain-containing protein [Ideonella sp.]|nr:PIN domain-containing protein [Ideonella sp.]MCC7456392.1 PIN domain-containing protein [Nitrospira sp.]
MKTPDVNLLLYAVNSDAPQHESARSWLEHAFGDAAGIGFCWAALVGFLRLATRAGILRRPLSLDEALQLVDDWLEHPAARVLAPTERHAAVLSGLLLAQGRGGNIVSDAHLAAVAIEHGAELGTFDRDFQHFAGLRIALLK